MQSFMITLLICSGVMSILGLAYMAATPFLSKHYSEKGCYYAWLIIVVGLIIPFRPQWGNALVKVEVPSNAPTAIVQMNGEASINYLAPITLSPIENIVVADTTASSLNFSRWHISTAVWLAGLLMFLIYHGIKHNRFTKMVRRWSKNITDENILSLLQCLKSEMEITRQMHIYLCPFVSSPMMIGIIKPKILLPTVELAQDELCFILKHELMHYKRKDLLYKYLILGATALHWFNPVVFLIAKAVNVLCETSCDTEILQGEDMDTRQFYGETIIDVVKYQSNLKTVLSTTFYGGKNSMNKRISSIMDTRKKKTGVIIIALVLTLAVGTGFVIATTPTQANGSSDRGFESSQQAGRFTPAQQNEEDNPPNVSHTLTPDGSDFGDLSEYQSPYRLAATLEEVRAILSLQDGSIPVTNVYVPEIINHQADGIIITRQDPDEAIAAMAEYNRLNGDNHMITQLVTTRILPPLTPEGLEFAVIVGFAHVIARAAIDAELNPEGVETLSPWGITISSAETAERLREEAQRVLTLHSEPSEELALEAAKRLFDKLIITF